MFNNGIKLKSTGLNDFSTDYIVRVFNSDFVKDNLGWLHNRDGSIQPFAVLGSDNVEIRDEIKNLEFAIKNDEAKSGYEYEKITLEEKKNSKMKAYNDFNKAFDIENKMTEFAADIRGKQQIYDRNPYNKTHLQHDFENAIKETLLSVTERETKLKQLEERELPNILYTVLEYTSFEMTINKSVDMLSKTISVSDDLTELVIDDLIS